MKGCNVHQNNKFINIFSSSITIILITSLTTNISSDAPSVYELHYDAILSSNTCNKLQRCPHAMYTTV